MADASSDVVAALQPIDVSAFVETGADESLCGALARSLESYGAALIRDARVSLDDSVPFRRLMESYFAQPRDAKLRDARPALSYQVGTTPDHIELPRENPAFVARLAPQHAPASARAVAARMRDPKWRFFWRVGDRPPPGSTRFPALNAPQVVPQAFENEWAPTLDAFGSKLLASVKTASEMLALGLGLPRNAFVDKLALGPHLLAPTGADLSSEELSSVGAVLAGIHYDINFLTIHAAASYPGLYIWTRDGVRLQVRVPKGMLLLQAGAQLEHLTGGAISRGFHEVVVSKETLAAVEEARRSAKSMWRVSSTMFGHVRSDESLAPLGHFAHREGAADYDILAGDQIAAELQAIALSDEAKA